MYIRRKLVLIDKIFRIFRTYSLKGIFICMKHDSNVLNELRIQNISKILSNPTKLSMLVYIKWAGYASAGSILRNVDISQSYVSKSLKCMTTSGIIIKEKIFSTTVYKVNQAAWIQFWDDLKIIGITLKAKK